jgi:hypothetical protein
MKKCNTCSEIKDINLFVKRNNRESGFQPYCKSCHNKKTRKNYSSISMKNYDLKKKYGIDINDYEALFIKQNGCCKICKVHISDANMKRKRNFCVDHCHKTNTIRGLLCDRCNRGIGLLKDDYKILFSAYEYLKETQCLD